MWSTAIFKSPFSAFTVCSTLATMFAQKSGTAKLDHVTKILADLRKDLDAPQLSSHQRKQQLEQLKVYGRDPTNADPIFTQDGLRTLGRYAFKEKDVAVSQEALRAKALTTSSWSPASSSLRPTAQISTTQS
ncbi:hypothetical protein OPT61_g6447 [Boeremia exigua]|uniref:Uncharacterized protein n=1 Tax=Boeremia exigua TaxID=749465 RepID=A0ACC2I6M6_9PLEO|nr:hypothetical protein OPT61_g6447 [Boeremia exigua]